MSSVEGLLCIRVTPGPDFGARCGGVSSPQPLCSPELPPGLLGFLWMWRVTRLPLLWLRQPPGYAGWLSCGALGFCLPHGLQPCVWFSGAQLSVTLGQDCSPCSRTVGTSPGSPAQPGTPVQVMSAAWQGPGLAPPIRPSCWGYYRIVLGRLGCLS